MEWFTAAIISTGNMSEHSRKNEEEFLLISKNYISAGNILIRDYKTTEILD